MRKLAVSSLLVLLFTTFGTSVASSREAYAAPNSESSNPSFVNTMTVSPAGVGWIRCRIDSHLPHYSKNAGGAIAKVTGSCSRYGIGMASTVRVSLKSTITLNGKWKAGRSGKFVIPTNGKKYTYYVPAVGKTAGRGCGLWKATHAATGSSPAGLVPKRTFSSKVNKCI